MSGDYRATYVKAAAVHATAAVARLMDCSEPKETPTLQQVRLGDLIRLLGPGGAPGFAIFADLSGAVGGQAGLLLSPDAAGELLFQLIGERPEGEPDAQARSALSEAGNIAVSAASGALGHLAGGVVIPSVPRLDANLQGALRLDELPPPPERDELPVYVVTTTLSGPSLAIAFVWVP